MKNIFCLLILVLFEVAGLQSTEIIYPSAAVAWPKKFLLSRRTSSANVTNNNNNRDRGCDCEVVEIVTTNEAVLRKHGELLGRYTRLSPKSDGLEKDGLYNGRPGYEHFSGKFFLYYNSASQGFWAIGERLGSEVVRLENQGDRMCPYYLKSLWRYADGDLNALVYDVTLRAACMIDPCSVAHCGHQARCILPPHSGFKRRSKNPKKIKNSKKAYQKILKTSKKNSKKFQEKFQKF
jgi:hypothetical protein